MKPALGMIVWAELGRRHPPGHEQQGMRPAIVVGLPSRLGTPRFPLLLVVPVTTYRAQAWVYAAPHLYPQLDAGAGNLPRPSVVLLDQLQVLDPRRVQKYVGTLSDEEYVPIREGLKAMLGM